jgi:hypothetical protein
LVSDPSGLGYSNFQEKDLNLKTASWLLSLLLAFFLAYSFGQVPTDDSNRSLHIASRYQQRAETETGIHSRAGAIGADYRSMDLLAVATLFTLAAFCIPLFFNNPPTLFESFPAFLLLVVGALLTLGMGFLCYLKGSNFLDYEGLASLTDPLKARLDGALALFGGALLSLGGLLVLWVSWLRSQGGSGAR